MKTLNSISGGATSAYMAINYPADYNVFALVCIDDPICKPKDPYLLRFANDKIQKHSVNKSEVIASAETDKTLKVVADLEQKLGREIAWVRGPSFDELILHRKALPNQFKRFCTTAMKIEPIAEWATKTIKEIVLMNQGIRFDEAERRKQAFKKGYIHSIEVIGKNGKPKNEKICWAIASYPLVENRIFYHKIQEFRRICGLDFPKDSNCPFCFWKPPQQLRSNFGESPEIMNWAKEMETKIGRRWKNGEKYNLIELLPIQTEFNFGTGSGCNAGFCTD